MCFNGIMPKKKQTKKRATTHRRSATKRVKKSHVAPGQQPFLAEIFALFQAPVK
jgi:hypothetical protein